MNFEKPTPEQALLALRGIKTVATVDGTEPLTDFHRQFVSAVQRYILETELDIDAVETISPEDLAAAVPDEEMRHYALHDLAYAALADPDVDAKERAKVVDRFAAAMKTDEPIVSAMHHAAKRQTMRLQFDALRIYTAAIKPGSWTERIRMMWKAIAPSLGVTDPKTAARYEALVELPEGTLGRAYHEFITSRNLTFPGQKNGAPELYFVAHDMTHILGEYDTDLTGGEVEIVGFEAGFRKRGGLDVILLALAQMQLGIVLDPVAPAETGKLNFDKLLSAYRRGREMKVDLGDNWDYWAVIDRQLPELREEYGILPKERFA